mgnify:CR=1 FL=1
MLSMGTMHRIWFSIQWGGRWGLQTFAIGRYRDLCLWGSDHPWQRFRTGPRWPVSWGLLTLRPK